MPLDIDHLIRETQQTVFHVGVLDELVSLVYILKDFEKEAKRKLEDITRENKEKSEGKQSDNEEGEIPGGTSDEGADIEPKLVVDVWRELRSLKLEDFDEEREQWHSLPDIATNSAKTQSDENISSFTISENSAFRIPSDSDAHSKQSPEQVQKFDRVALNNELKNLFASRSQKADPQPKPSSTDTPSEVPATPPTTPSTLHRPLPPQEQELPLLPPSLGPPPRKPPRANIPPPKPPRTFEENLRLEATQSSRSASELGSSSGGETSPLEEELRSPVIPPAFKVEDDFARGSSEKKENAIFSSLRGKKVKEKISSTLGIRRDKRPSPQISDPMDFRVLSNGTFARPEPDQRPPSGGSSQGN